MNGVRWLLLILVVVYIVLWPLSRRVAVGYARLALLSVIGAIILMPFFWLLCAAFKDKTVLNEYTFLPPMSKISSQTINLGNFRSLLAPKQTVQGHASEGSRHCIPAIG